MTDSSTESPTIVAEATSPAAPEGQGTSPAPQPAASTADVLYPEAASSEGEASQSAAADSASGSTEAAGTLESDSGADTLGGDSSSDALTADSYAITFPEGYTADDALLGEAKSALATAGVDPAKAQPLIDLFVSAQQRVAAAETSAFEATQSAWLAEINALPAFKGPTRETSLQAISALLDEFGPEAKSGIFNDPRVGNNPQIVKFLHSVAQHFKEGTPTPPPRPAPLDRNGRPVQRGVAETLYPNLTQ